ncbi:Bax inhibitor-1/YccA family protein [Muricoccus radiodurans]|uniref:Bax inhibitor-1/YccA family protein n=1 Tax=Muricoccus radiodurans TaxID=2231721 RepID=UPI003CE868B8
MAFGPDNRFQPTQSAWTQPLGRAATDAATLDAGLRAYMLRVYNWMASGLALTAITAYLIANTPGIREMFFTIGRSARGNIVTQPTILGFAAIFAPLVFVLVLSFGINRLSKTSAQALFWAFCVAMGASMANIFVVYVGASVASTFFVTAGMFAAVSIYGYTTKADLTRMGGFLMMGLIGIIIAGLVNMFFQSSALQFAISVIGVVVFVGLTAFDTQRIKNDYLEYAYAEGGDEAAKRSVIDALGLYLNFVNLFQLLLQFMGVRSSSD